MKEKAKTDPVCSNCKTRDTPLWRRGPNNTYNCNACGLYYEVYKQSRPSKYRSAACHNRKRLHRERGVASDSRTPACDAPGGHTCSPRRRSSSFFQDPYMYNDIATVDRSQPLVEGKVEPNKRSKVVVGTLFDVFGRESKDKTGEKLHSMQEPKDAKEVKAGRCGETMHTEEAHLFDRTCEGGEKVFAYKTGISFHVGKYVQTSSHSAGVSQKGYASGFPPGLSCFRTSQSRVQPYTDVSGGIEFPKIRMVSVDSFRFRHGERKMSLLSKEEMEAAEALADFAYRARHGECD